MFSLRVILELVGLVLQALTPFYEIPLDEIQTIFDSTEDIGLEWRIVNETSQRRVLEYVPSSPLSSSRPAVFLVFHGFNGNPSTLFTAGTPAFRELLDYADTKGFIVMAPEATTLDTPLVSPRSWNDYGRDFLKPNVDDVAFVAELIDWAVLEHNIDRERVFLAGVSGGGSMIYRLLHERSDLFRGAAPLISLLPKADVPPPVSYRPTPIITVAGTRDTSFFFNGGHSPFYDARSFVDTLTYMAGLNGAKATDAIVSGDLERIAAPFVRINKCNVDRIVYVGDTATATATATATTGPIEAYIVNGGGHHVPGTELYPFYRPLHPVLFGPVTCDAEFDFLATMVAFFERFGL